MKFMVIADKHYKANKRVNPKFYLDELGMTLFNHLAMFMEEKYLIKIVQAAYYKGQMDLMKNYCTMPGDQII